ncbi:MAG: hypothetical protein RJB53_1136, partial [Pseudomonadota bacterium]
TCRGLLKNNHYLYGQATLTYDALGTKLGINSITCTNKDVSA